MTIICLHATESLTLVRTDRHPRFPSASIRVLLCTCGRYIEHLVVNTRTVGEQAAKRFQRHAQHMAILAVQAGMLDRPTHCINCGKAADVQSHHFDYSRPLEVEWLCSSCHSRLHAEAA